MQTNQDQKYGAGLQVIRGGKYATPKPRRSKPRTAEELRLLDRMRAAYAAMRSKNGTAPSRAHREIAQGRQQPLSIAMKHARAAFEAGVPLSENEKPVLELLHFVRALYDDAA